MKRLVTALLAHLTLLAATNAQQAVVIPNSYENADAPAYGWVAGASQPLRQQTLIGGSHMAPLLNKVITALEFRRHAASEIYHGGSANLTLTLSIAPHAPIDCLPAFAANTGPTPVEVHSGIVTFPTSPTPAGAGVPWTPDNIVRIQFSQPFVYLGGTLCVDLLGEPIAGQNAEWWMADLELEDIAGSSMDLGGGCGVYGGAEKIWSRVSDRSLLPGAQARFSAYGTPGGLALAAFGNAATVGIPLAATGLPGGAECDLWLADLTAIQPTLFLAPQDPADLSFGGEAEVQFRIPNSPSSFGITLTTQWIDWSQMATSNAIEWTVASSVPTADLALIEGDPTEPSGKPAPYMGHVFRFEHQ